MKEENELNKMTYQDIFTKFIQSTDIRREKIADWKPCVEMYCVLDIVCGIVIWLTDGTKMIYLPYHNDLNVKVIDRENVTFTLKHEVIFNN